MPVGDSITMGSDLRGGYRRPLNDSAPNLVMLGSLCVIGPDYTVGQHEGTPGATIDGVRAIALPQADVYLPAIVLLMAGTNDILTNTGTADQIIANYVLLAQQFLAKASVTKVIVGSIAPRPSDSPDFAKTVAFNAGLSAAFAGLGPSIVYYNVCGGLTFSDPDQMEPDGIHPNTLGYATTIAPAWLAAIISENIQIYLDPVVAEAGTPGY